MAKGQADFKRYKKGVRLTRSQSINAKCYSCTYEGMGGIDCEIRECPLYPYSYYGVEKEGDDE